jgi:hypothetical protein
MSNWDSKRYRKVISNFIKIFEQVYCKEDCSKCEKCMMIELLDGKCNIYGVQMVGDVVEKDKA